MNVRCHHQPVSTSLHNNHNRYSPGYRVNKLNKKSNSRPVTAMIKIGGVTSTAAKKSWSQAEQRTELCHAVKAGIVCRYGDACKFVHDRSRLPSTLKVSWSQAEQRTELCHAVKAGIVCRYGDACKFVHDRSRLPITLKDLVLLNQIKKEDIMTYRNRPCFDFISTGTW